MPGSIGFARFWVRPKYVFRIGVVLVFADGRTWRLAQNFARIGLHFYAYMHVIGGGIEYK